MMLLMTVLELQCNELETTMKTILSKDKKFIHLLEVVHADFGHGYEELMELKEKQY